MGEMINLTEAEWCIYASVQHANIALDNGLSPVSEPMLEYC